MAILRNLNSADAAWANIIGTPFAGVLAEDVPSTGENGAGYLYDSLSFPSDTGKHVRGRIVTWPTNGTLVAYEDSSFVYDGTSDTFEFQLYVDHVAVGSPTTITLNVGGASVQPTGISSAEAFGSALATWQAQVTTSSIVSAEAFGTALITQAGVFAILPTGIASAESFGSPVLAADGAYSIAPTGISSAEGFGNAALAITRLIEAAGIASAESFGSASLTRHSLSSISASGIPSTEVFGNSTVASSSVPTVSPEGIASSESFGTPTLSWDLTATITPSGISSGESFGAAELATYVLEDTSVNGNEVLDTIMARIGRWTDTALRASALNELRRVQREYEQGRNLPWFLFASKTTVLAADSAEADLPTGFLRFDDEQGFVRYLDDNGCFHFLEIVDFQLLQEQACVTAGVPRYAAISDKVYVYPPSSEELTLTVHAAYKDSIATDAASTNAWLTNADYVMIPKVAWRMANSYLQDFQLAQNIHVEVLEAEARLASFIAARRHARTDRIKGEE